MSSAIFLMADEYNFQLTAYVLEIFNNIIHYQFKENPNLVYSIVLHHDSFEKLERLTFQDAVKEVERVRLARESKSAATIDDAEAPATATDTTATTDTNTTATDATDATDANTNTNDTDVKATMDDIETKVTENSAKINENEVKPAESQVREEPSRRRQDSQELLRTRNGFMPTEAWMLFWKSKLPLKTISRLLKELVPKVEEKCVGNNASLEEIMEFLKSVDIKDILTEQDTGFIRKFQWGEALVIWFRSMMWGQNYVSSMKEHGAWNGTHVKLFQIKAE